MFSCKSFNYLKYCIHLRNLLKSIYFFNKKQMQYILLGLITELDITERMQSSYSKHFQSAPKHLKSNCNYWFYFIYTDISNCVWTALHNDILNVRLYAKASMHLLYACFVGVVSVQYVAIGNRILEIRGISYFLYCVTFIHLHWISMLRNIYPEWNFSLSDTIFKFHFTWNVITELLFISELLPQPRRDLDEKFWVVSFFGIG